MDLEDQLDLALAMAFGKPAEQKAAREILEDAEIIATPETGLD